jgi:hypothetical protein
VEANSLQDIKSAMDEHLGLGGRIAAQTAYQETLRKRC